MRTTIAIGASVAILAVATAAGWVAAGQARDHGPGGHGQAPMQGRMHAGPGAHGDAAGLPTSPGQEAFGAIAEIVRLLDADPATDWSRVDLERLRQHLVDMNEVVLHAAVRSTPVEGGLVMDVAGEGRVEQAIRAMVLPHARELDAMPDLVARAWERPRGVRLTVTAADAADGRAVARIRGLGFAGLLTLGAHHQAHHLAMAKGEAMPGHAH